MTDVNSAVYSEAYAAKIDAQGFQPGVCSGVAEVTWSSDENIKVKVNSKHLMHDSAKIILKCKIVQIFVVSVSYG